MSPPPDPLRYPPSTLLVDALSGAGGLLVCALVLLVDGLPVAIAALGVAGVALFAWFAVQCLRRARLCLHLDATGVSRVAPPLRIDWDTLEGLTLRYFSLRRDRERGWFELGLRGPGGLLTVDSRLSDFEALLDAALAAARRRELDLDPVTLGNLVDVRTDDDRMRA